MRTLEIAPRAHLSISLRGRLTCLCPVNGRRDYAAVEVAYCPTGGVLELESFAAYLATYGGRTVSHEDATAEIRAEIAALLKPGDLTVTTTWDAVEGVECVVRAVG